MLRVAALGMFLYGLHDVVVGSADLIGAGTLEWWANVWRVLAGAMLMLAAALVRVSMPGGLALAVAALLGATLVALAYFGWGIVGGERTRTPPRANRKLDLTPVQTHRELPLAPGRQELQKLLEGNHLARKRQVHVDLGASKQVVEAPQAKCMNAVEELPPHERIGPARRDHPKPRLLDMYTHIVRPGLA